MPHPFRLSASSRIVLQRLLACVCVISITSCGWVDSTGVHGSSNQVVVLDDTVSPDTAVLGRTEFVNENSRQRYQSSLGAISAIAGWNWGAPYRSGVLPECSVDNAGFERFGVRTLNEACTDKRQCALAFSQRDTNGSFDVVTPRLRAPVGLSYRLTAVDGNGNTAEEFISFCLQSINEAPIARDDLFTVARGSEKRVQASDVINLLSNDYDDVDVQNQPLKVDPVPHRAPLYAAQFELGTAGGFVYLPDTRRLPPAGVTITDSFEYRISDGLHTSVATVYLRVTDLNNAPTLNARLTDLQLIAGEPLAIDDTRFDLSRFFSDPDGDTLNFGLATGTLPVTGTLALTQQGRLQGTPSSADRGEYVLTIVASDGDLSASDTKTLSIVTNTAPGANSPPEIEPITDALVIAYEPVDITIAAQDPDFDIITYSFVTTPPQGLSIDTLTGRIQGLAPAPASYAIRVSASDGQAASTIEFILVVRPSDNRAPVVDDISNRVFTDDFVYDVAPFFTDPDGDAMTFSARGLPNGVEIRSDGNIVGLVGRNNIGTHLVTVTATDSRGASTSDRFRLIIR